MHQTPSRIPDLSLAKWDGVESAAWVAFVGSKLEQCHGRVGSRRQDEDERCTAVGVTKRLGQIERRRLNKVLAELLSDKVGDGRHNLHTIIQYIHPSVYLLTLLAQYAEHTVGRPSVHPSVWLRLLARRRQISTDSGGRWAPSSKCEQCCIKSRSTRINKDLFVCLFQNPIVHIKLTPTKHINRQHR